MTSDEIKTVGEWLIEYFGEESTAAILKSNPHAASMPSLRPHLQVRENDGGLYVNCGGEAIMSFGRHDNIRGSVFLVRNDDLGKQWEADKRNGGNKFFGPRPDPKLKLAYSI